VSKLTDTISPTNKSSVFEYTAADINAAQGNSSILQAICNRCQDAGITWEGVYDGDVCQGLNRATMGGSQQCQ
jgi:hypothetical protein